jgi:hypothetical protein
LVLFGPTVHTRENQKIVRNQVGMNGTGQLYLLTIVSLFAHTFLSVCLLLLLSVYKKNIEMNSTPIKKEKIFSD